MGDTLRIGLVGAGNISGQYVRNLPRLDNVQLTRIADIERRQGLGAGFGGRVAACTPEELYAASMWTSCST